MPPMATQLRILVHGARVEIPKIKGSRFIACVEPFDDERQVEGLVEPMRRAFPQANHHCWAWRLGRNRDHFRWNDDGEPGGSAGRPILQQIEARHLTNTFVVVTRIFGGTRLGIGGLARAYGTAAAQALDQCVSEEWVLRRRLRITVAYEFDGIVKSELLQAGLEAVGSHYDTEVHLDVDVPEEDVDALRALLGERTAGRARIVAL
jgi:uncharacterized YigZ family protein